MPNRLNIAPLAVAQNTRDALAGAPAKNVAVARPAAALRTAPRAAAMADDDTIPLESLSVVVFDCETDCGFERLCGYSREAFVRQIMPRAQHARSKFRRSCVWSMHEVGGPNEVLKLAKKHTFWRDQAEEGKSPVHELLALFDRALLIVGYNCAPL